MKIRQFIIPLLIFALSSAGWTQGTQDNSAGTGTMDYTTYAGLSALMDRGIQGKDFFLIDVRTKEEFAAGHIPSALLIPVQVFEANIPTDDKNALIILYCRSGARAGTALNILKSKGYTNAYNFGSYRKWEGELATGE